MDQNLARNLNVVMRKADISDLLYDRKVLPVVAKYKHLGIGIIFGRLALFVVEGYLHCLLLALCILWYELSKVPPQERKESASWSLMHPAVNIARSKPRRRGCTTASSWFVASARHGCPATRKPEPRKKTKKEFARFLAVNQPQKLFKDSLRILKVIISVFK